MQRVAKTQRGGHATETSSSRNSPLTISDQPFPVRWIVLQYRRHIVLIQNIDVRIAFGTKRHCSMVTELVTSDQNHWHLAERRSIGEGLKGHPFIVAFCCGMFASNFITVHWLTNGRDVLVADFTQKTTCPRDRKLYTTHTTPPNPYIIKPSRKPAEMISKSVATSSIRFN